MAANKEKDENINNNGQGTQDQAVANINLGNDNTGANSDNGGTDVSANNNSGEKTFTQAEVTKMMAKEKHQGANSVYNELGIKPGDKKALFAIKEYLASQRIDEQKSAEVDVPKAQDVYDAQQRAVIAETKAEAMMAGVQTQFVEDATTLALAKVAAEDGTDIKTALGELKAKYPVWFSMSDDNENDKSKIGQKGTGSSVKSSDKDKGSNAKSLGARLAANKRNTGKATYWSAKK